MSHVMSSTVSEVTCGSVASSVGEDKLIYAKHIVLPLGARPSGDLSLAPIRGEEHDAQNTTRMYKDNNCEDTLEFDDTYVRAPTQQKLNIDERFAIYNASEMDKVTRIDEREE